MPFYYLAGSAANLVTTSTLSSTSADANFPLANLKSDFLWKMFRFNSAAADMTLTADLGSSKAVDFSSVHFHNIDSGITSLVLQSDDNSGFSSATTRATFTLEDPAFYKAFTSASERYWRLKFNGTNTGGAVYIGKWSLGARSELTRAQKPIWTVSQKMEQLVGPSNIRVNRSLFAARTLKLPFLHYTLAQKEEIQSLIEAAEWGQAPIVVAPDSSDAIVLYGRVDESWSQKRKHASIYEHTVTIVEDQFPVIVN